MSQSKRTLSLASPYRVEVLKSRAKKREIELMLKQKDNNLLFNPRKSIKKKVNLVVNALNPIKGLRTEHGCVSLQSPVIFNTKPVQSSTLSCLSLGKIGIKHQGSGDLPGTVREKASWGINSPDTFDPGRSCISITSRSNHSIFSTKTLKNIKELNLLDSPLDPVTFSNIFNILLKPDPSLIYLNLENTGITDKNIENLCEVLYNDRTLIFLGLARNSLTFKSCRSIKELLKENSHMQKLDLHWNSSKDLGALLIFQGLCLNSTLKELDLSWNGIGSNKDPENIRKMSDCFEHFQGLAHLDLSYNHLTTNECQILAKGLEKNHAILGIHFAGNEGKIDCQGFLRPFFGQINVKESHLFTRIFNMKRKNVRKDKNFCWLCEKWVECELEFGAGVVPQGCLGVGDVYLHLESDEFQAEALEKADGKLRTVRVLPAGNQKFFFSVPGNVFLLPKAEKFNLNTPVVRTVDYSEDIQVEIVAKIVNEIYISGNQCNYNKKLKTYPRRPRFNKSADSIKLPQLKWSIDISIFKDLQFLSKSLLSDCLLFDWSQSRLPKLIKKPEEQYQLQQILLRYYDSIVETFKSLSIQSGNEIPSIGSNVFTEFLNQGELLDEYFSKSDLGVNWTTVITTKSRQPYNPGNALVRYEFTEILIRISIDRYIRHKRSKNVIQAFQCLLKEALEKLLRENNSQVWRTQKMMNEKIDVTLKAFKPILEFVYKANSGSKTLPGMNVFMSLEEFKKVFIDSKILDHSVPAREIDGCFYLAISVEVDEVFEKKHIEMNYYEFLEGLCRVSELSNIWEIGKSLRYRVYNCCRLLMALCPKSLFDSFVVPSKAALKSLRLN